MNHTYGLKARWRHQDWLYLTGELRGIDGKDGAFDYVRFHGIFNRGVGVFHLNAQGQPVYNFSYVDQIYDGLLARGVRPFVELSFMPPALAARPGREIRRMTALSCVAIGIAFLLAVGLLVLAGVLLGWVIPALIERSRRRKDASPPNTR